MEKSVDSKVEAPAARGVAYEYVAPVAHVNKIMVVFHWVYFVVYCSVSVLCNCTVLQIDSPLQIGFLENRLDRSTFGICFSINNLTRVVDSYHTVSCLASYANILLFVSGLLSLSLVCSKSRGGPGRVYKTVASIVCAGVLAINVAAVYAMVIVERWQHQVQHAILLRCLLFIASFICCVVHGYTVYGSCTTNKRHAQILLPYTTEYDARV